jgi:hypothetical protein
LQKVTLAIHEPTERLRRLAHAPQDQVTSWRSPLVLEALQTWHGVPSTAPV